MQVIKFTVIMLTVCLALSVVAAIFTAKENIKANKKAKTEIKK
jgi:hypothetical protein